MYLSSRAAAHRRNDLFDNYLTVGLIVSLLVHILLFLLFRPGEHKELPEPIMVSVVTEMKRPAEMLESKKQIITTPDSTSDKEPPKDTNLFAEKNSTAEKEQIHRGDAPEAGPAVSKKADAPLSPPAPEKKQSAAKQSEPQTTEQGKPTTGHTIKSFKLDESTALEKFGGAQQLKLKPEQTLQDQLSSGQVADLSNYRPFSRPFSSGAAFLGRQGASDYLPNLPDGDLTMLNAKANRFAGFVRRVATQVFAQLRQQGWDSLRGSDVARMEQFSDVRAVLSKKGELLSVKLESTSGSPRFDEVLVKSVKLGARDPNPPPQAATEDGNIHIIFLAKSWVGGASDPRGGGLFERRWLLLGTGLE